MAERRHFRLLLLRPRLSYHEGSVLSPSYSVFVTALPFGLSSDLFVRHRLCWCCLVRCSRTCDNFGTQWTQYWCVRSVVSPSFTFFPSFSPNQVNRPAVPRVTTQGPPSLVDTVSSIMWPSPHDFSRASTKGPQINAQSPFLTLTIIMETGVSVIHLSHVLGCRANFLRSARNILLRSQRPLRISPRGRRLPLYIFHAYM